MAAISKDSFLSIIGWRQPMPKKTKKENELAVRAYKATNGPTDELRSVYRAYLANKAKSNKSAR